MENDKDKRCTEISRRQVLKYGTFLGVSLCGTNAMAQFFQECVTDCPDEVLPDPTNCGIQEIMSTTPFILTPFIDPLPVPVAMRPGFLQRVAGGTLADWTVRKSTDAQGQCILGDHVVDPAQMLPCKQDSYGGTHQIIPTDTDATLTPARGFPGQFQVAPVPITYHIRLQVAEHRFTSSRVRPINRRGRAITPAARAALRAGGAPANLRRLPPSTIYGFNGTFPGPMINVDYGKPVIVRFENDLDLLPGKPAGVDEATYRGDFGVPQFCTHLHNGHTAAESDGQPHYMRHNDGGYNVADYCDNLYLNWPAGGDPNEMMSFLWFHDHRMDHTGANVYKGMVGLFPMYDPGVPDPANQGQLLPGTGLDTGDETRGLRLPGVRVDNPDGTFNVKYDIPMAFYDVRLDDGVTPHADFRVGDALIKAQLPIPVPPPVDETLCGAVHPEQWGKTFFRYHPNHGFVGDLFTINGKAFPVLDVFQRRYRFRFLDASIARCYELCLMTSAAGPVGFPGTDGQWQIPDGQFWRPMRQIASEGGLLPDALRRNSIQIWPAKRREVVVDFTNAPTGTVIYLTNILEMPDGRKPNFNPPGRAPRGLNPQRINALPYKVPMLKIVVGGPPPEPDRSRMPGVPATPDPQNPTLRPMPAIPDAAALALLPHREFTLKRSGTFGDNAQWLINDLPFNPAQPLTELPNQPGNPGNIGNPKLGTGEVWTVINGGGGWVHPMHMHMEEHHTIAREGSENIHPDDTGKEDVVALDPGESVTFFRRFRTFLGPYVAHCHNLAHEDHAMMFGWKIDP